jgi:hypothetical protein
MLPAVPILTLLKRHVPDSILPAGWAQPLIWWELPMKMGAPLFAFFAKGGHDAAGSANFDSAEISCSKQQLTRPCNDRKSWASTSLRRI